ncbi:MAG: DNA topology modulation protein [Gemmatimonadaceae bacterium]
MQRILIIGCAGAGKSTFATALGGILRLPVIHLDSHFWQPNWKETERSVWHLKVGELLARDAWIMDGNYGGTMAMRVASSDTIIFLDFPRSTCLFRVLKRGIKYWHRERPDIGKGCAEQLPDFQFLKFIWTYRRTRRPIILELLRANEEEKRVVILRSPRELTHFVASSRAEVL